MIIKCEKCSTAFRLPDEKIKPEGTRVRCSKCKNVFIVYPPRKEASEDIPELSEKTRIAFVSSPFGEEKEDEGPITVKKHREEIGPSIETLGHGIPLSSPEIKKVEEPSKDLNEIMAAISEGLKVASGESAEDVSPNSDSIPSTSPENISSPPEQQGISTDLDSLLDNLSDIQPDVKQEKKEEAAEELPDLSSLLSAIPFQPSPAQPLTSLTEERNDGIPDLSTLLSQPLSENVQQGEKTAQPIKQPETPPPARSVEDKLSLDIDKAFDSLFAEQPSQEATNKPPATEQQQPRKTMLYMEAVPVAPPNPLTQPTPKESPPFETLELSGLSKAPDSQIDAQPAIQDSLLSDDLSMFLSHQTAKSEPVSPPPPTLNLSDDLLSGLSIPPAGGMQEQVKSKESPLQSAGPDLSLSFGDLGEISGDIPPIRDEGRFSTTQDRSSDLMAQMDSIGSIPLPSQPATHPGSGQSIELKGVEDVSVPTVSEVKAEKRSQPPATIKPPTIALKETEKSIKSEIVKWSFALMLMGFMILNILTPSITFPDVKEDIFKILRTPFVDNSVMIENLYYRNINERDTLLIFVGSIHLTKAISPQDLMIRFRITDLAGAEITQIEYPLTYTEDLNSVKNINSLEDIKKFLKENRLKIITHRTNRFIAPLILTNVDLNRVDIKTDLVTVSR